MSPAGTWARRGLSLIEVVTVIVVLAIAVPPALRLVHEAVSGRVDAINLTRATALASALAEHVLADVASNAAGLGFGALDDAAAWETSLRDRAAATAAPYAAVGMSYEIGVGPLADAAGVVSGDAGEDLYRDVEIRVSYPRADGVVVTYELVLVVTELTP